MISLLLAAAAASVQPPPVSALLARARVSIPDARQISDLQICPPRHISADGRRFTVLISFNRPNAARAYWAADWRDDRFVDISDMGWHGDEAGFEVIAKRAMERQFEDRCRWVSSTELAASWTALDHGSGH